MKISFEGLKKLFSRRRYVSASDIVSQWQIIPPEGENLTKSVSIPENLPESEPIHGNPPENSSESKEYLQSSPRFASFSPPEAPNSPEACQNEAIKGTSSPSEGENLTKFVSIPENLPESEPIHENSSESKEMPENSSADSSASEPFSAFSTFSEPAVPKATSRPRENGIAAANPPTIDADPSKMTLAQIRDVVSRAKHGEKISF